MAAIKQLLSQAHRHHQHFIKTTQPYLSLLLKHHYIRPFCSTPPEPPSANQPDSNDPNPNPRTAIPLNPVSYAVKQTAPESPPPELSQTTQRQQYRNGPDPDGRNDVRAWTREDFRYMKDAPPSVSPVAYPTRVAPLPEDRVWTEDHEGKEEVGRDEELERERSRIEAGNRNFIRPGLRIEEEKVPFPILIIPENNSKGKVIYDLKEAIQLVKANAKHNFEETLELHVKLTPELRRTDLKLSGSVLLPHGSGKKFRVAVFAEGDAAEEAREAGATRVGGLEFIEEIKSGKH